MKKPTLIGLLFFVLSTLAFSQGEWIEENTQVIDGRNYKFGKFQIHGKVHSIERSGNLSNADLSGADLSGAYLYNLNLNGANLANVNLEESYIYQAQFFNANLENVNFRNAYFVLIGFEGVDFKNANFEKTTLSNVSFRANADGSCDLSKANLTKIQIDNNTRFYPGTKLPEAYRISQDKLWGPNIVYDYRVQLNKEFPLNDLNFSGSEFFPGNDEYAGLEADLCDLTGSDFSYASLRGADFRNSNLTNVDFTGANLGNADLRGAILTGANLTGANLSGALTDGALGLAVSPREQQISDLITQLAEAISTINNLSANNPDDETQEARANEIRLKASPDNNTIKLFFEIEESDDLNNWNKTGETISKTIQLKEGKKFYRFTIENP